MDNPVNFTEEQVRELARCYFDPVYFIENYCWIELKEQNKIVPAKLYPYQKTILQWLTKGESGVVLKSRRIGGSTIVTLWVGWKVNFRRGVNALLLSRNETMAKKLVAKVKFSLFNLRKHTSDDFSLAEDASWMLNSIAVNTQLNLSIGWQDKEGNIVSTSDVESLTTTGDSARGDSATFIFMDEMAFLQDQEATSRSARLTTTRGGHWLAISTPNGVGDSFHGLCMRAERGENDSYNFMKVHWSEAGMDEAMIRRATEGMSDASRLQEMEMEFLASGDPVFSHVHLSACYRPFDEYPDVLAEAQAYDKLVKTPKSDAYYYIGVDSAVGKLNKRDAKRDYHSFTALTKSGLQVFAYHSKEESLIEWAGNIEQTAAGDYRRVGTVSRLHKEYPGIMHVEINGPGMTVYSNHRLPDDGVSNIVPKQTNMKTKDQLIRQLILAVESHSIIITDRFTYQCMVVFQRGSMPGSYNAPNGDYYDDPVISLALAWDAILSMGAIEFSWGATGDNLERLEKSPEAVQRAEIDAMPFGPAVSGKVEATDRLSTHFNEDSPSIFISDLDISRVNEPEFAI
jgi:hypothetical protein